ncbi:MAG: hypothetical protein QM790_04000 [Nibricoccus sp.]
MTDRPCTQSKQVRFSGVVTVFAFLALIARSEDQTTPEPLNTTPIVLDAVSVTAIKERLKAYELATKSFWFSAQESHTVSYLDVITMAYGKAEFDLATVLLKKKAYRDHVGALGHDFFCNYAAIDKSIPVFFRALADDQHPVRRRSNEWAYYDFKRKAIYVERQLYYSSLLQAAGLSLCTSPSPAALERIKKIGAQKKDFEFLRQVTFEVELQDLNRFYALYSKRPIMTPLDTLEALCMLGEKPRASTVQAILERNGFKVDPALIRKIIESTKERQAVVLYDAPPVVESMGPANNGPESFLGAHRLITGFTDNDYVVATGLRRESGQPYEKFLERILIEAPGHI